MIYKYNKHGSNSHQWNEVFIKMRILVTENQLRGIIKEMAISTYHGTPHDFDKFTTSKVGTGESTQWFGWGLYFTDDESISDWYASSVAKARNEEHMDKEYRLYYKDNLIHQGKPLNFGRMTYWKFMDMFKDVLTGLPMDIVGASFDAYQRFLNYKEMEISGQQPSFPWFDREKFINEFNLRSEKTRKNLFWTTKAYKDEATGYWKVPEMDVEDPYIVSLFKKNKESLSHTNPKDYIDRHFTRTVSDGWLLIGRGNARVDFNLLTDEKLNEIRDLLLKIFSSIQPGDITLKKNEPLYKKTIKYHVTLHKGKTPDEYDYLSWYDEMTLNQKQKVLSKLKEEGYTSEKFFMVTPVDEDNLEAIKPRFFESVRDAKYYIQKQALKVSLSGEGYLGSLKIVKTGFNMKNDINDTVQNFYTKLCGLTGSDKMASMFLLRAGIDGIKYPNNTVSGGKTTGFNYVVFDENSVQIDKKEDRELR
jgi:hypothetical protein